jgi:hypothetical protein
VLIAKKLTVQSAQDEGHFAQGFLDNLNLDAKRGEKFDINFTEYSLNSVETLCMMQRFVQKRLPRTDQDNNLREGYGLYKKQI